MEGRARAHAAAVAQPHLALCFLVIDRHTTAAAAMVSRTRRAEAEAEAQQRKQPHARSPRSLVDSFCSSSRAACEICVVSSLQQRRRTTQRQPPLRLSTLALRPQPRPLHRQSPRPPRLSLTPRSITRRHPLDERSHHPRPHQALRHPRALLLLFPLLRPRLPLPLLPSPGRPPSLHARARLSSAASSPSCWR